jgi:hypothetical protein
LAILETQRKENVAKFNQIKTENLSLFAKEKKSNEELFDHEKNELKDEANRQLI